MQTKNKLQVLLVFALLFTLLFHQKSLGINLVIFEASIFIWFAFTRQIQLRSFFEVLLFGSTLASLGFTILHHSTWSYIIHFAVFFTYIGVLIAPNLRSLVNVIGMSFSNVFLSFHELFRQPEEKTSNQTSKKQIRLRKFRFYIIPLAIIILFATLYGYANPDFGAYVDMVLGELYRGLHYLFKSFDFFWIMTFLLGFVITVFIFKRRKNEPLEHIDAQAQDEKLRIRNKSYRSSMMRLKNEYRAAVFLFGTLNVLLLLMNIMDIDKVWLNFEFEGQYLKQFVHHGTIVLIIAILLSIVLVLTFFRGNLNFYKNNTWLKRLCYLWLAQNGVLAISAGIRNLYYIQYYSLAYKRIAIVFFLILTMYGLYSVFIKVRDTRSTFYMLRKNANAWLIVLVLSAGFNWDRIIAKYNFSRAEGSFVHLDFLADLSDSALPYLDKPLDKVVALDKQQYNWFKSLSSSSFSRYRELYMTPEKYALEIEFRKAVFQIQYAKKSWLEWNYAEWDTYKRLKNT